LKILRTAGASLSLRGEGPHQLPQKRSLTFVSSLRSLAATEIGNAQHLRDFRSTAIFEFFNTIRQLRSFRQLPLPARLLPVSSTMQMLVCLTDTSNPAKWSMLRFSF
jgi:hypothetical protein